MLRESVGGWSPLLSLDVQGLREAQRTLNFTMVIWTPALPLPSSSPLPPVMGLKRRLQLAPQGLRSAGDPTLCYSLLNKSESAHMGIKCDLHVTGPRPVPRGAG